MPSGQEAQGRAGHQARALLHIPGARLPRMRSRPPLPVEGACEQGCRARERLSRASARATPSREMVGGRSRPLPAPPLAVGGLPWRGEDMAWARPRGPARPPEHAYSSFPHGGSGQPQEAGSCALSGSRTHSVDCSRRGPFDGAGEHEWRRPARRSQHGAGLGGVGREYPLAT